MKKFISNIAFGNRFFCVEQTLDNGKTSYKIIELKKVKDQIKVENTNKVDNVKNISESVPKDKPVFLVINDQFVVTKKVSSAQTDNTKLLGQAFPNIKIEDFHYEILSQEQVHFISICRKTHVNDLLESYKTQHISVIDFSLGNLMISSISNFIDEDEIRTNNAVVIKQDGLINDIRSSGETIKTRYDCNGIEDLSNEYLLSFASGLSLITKSKQTVPSFKNEQYDLLTNFKEKRFFKQFLIGGFSVLFVLLIINSMLFTEYYEKVNQLKETAQILDVSKQKIVELNEKVQTTKKMVDYVLKGNASQSSFYTDAIIQSLPEGIMLSELNYQPLLKRIKDNKPISNDLNTIIVSGDISKYASLPEWISFIDNMSWVNDIDIITFDDTTKRLSHFSVKIRIKNETKA